MITASAQKFANKFYSKLDNTQNIFVSPLSIEVALAMASTGAAGNTRQELVEVFDFPSKINKQNAKYSELMNQLNNQTDVKLSMANALWGQKDLIYKPEFKESIQNSYDGQFGDVDFVNDPDQALDTINGWVSEKTNDKIQQILSADDISAATRLVLTNAIYFKGNWRKPFESEDTIPMPFYGTGDVEGFPGKITTDVQMMHRTGKIDYFENDDFQAVDLPYKGDEVSMLVVLPKGDDLEWDTQVFYDIIDGLEREQVKLSLPKFKIEAKYKLRPVLEQLGIVDAFKDNADFSNIGDIALKISEVIHQTFVECDELGTEAAAATAVTMMCCTAMAPVITPKEFNVNRPFMFFIRMGHCILFCGSIVSIGE